MKLPKAPDGGGAARRRVGLPRLADRREGTAAPGAWPYASRCQ